MPVPELTAVCPSCLGAMRRAVTVAVRPAAPVEIFYSVPDAAGILKVSSATVRGYIASGVLPARQLGTARDRRGARYRVARRDLARFLCARQGETVATGG